MAHQLFRLLDSVYNTPHMVTASALEPIIEYLQDRNNNITFSTVIKAESPDKKKATKLGEIGEIAIDGVLTYAPVMGSCGPVGCSYQGILAQAYELVDEGAKTLVLVHSSPGGQAVQCFSTAMELRKLCNDNGVRLISYIDTMSASASLALGIVADEVIIHPEASTGSIGCVVAMVDKSKALSMAGLKPIFISSTPGKVAFNADGSYSEEFLAQMQEEVTRLGNKFASHVSEHTGLSTEEILEMDARMFHAEEALSRGLVNKVMDHTQLADYLAGN